MRKTLFLAVASAMSFPFVASAACPPMHVYDVAGVTASNVPLPDALRMLTTGTAWSVEVVGDAGNTRLSYRNVSGPLDQVLARAIAQAGQAAGRPVSSVNDPTRCVVTVNVPEPPRPDPPQIDAPSSDAARVAEGVPAPAPIRAVPLPPPPQVLRAGENLSEALADFVQRGGWSLRWNIEDDYVLDVDLPMPTGDVIAGVTWVVKTYQAQGGLEGVVPRFAKGNHVVVIEDMRVREAEGNP